MFNWIYNKITFFIIEYSLSESQNARFYLFLFFLNVPKLLSSILSSAHIYLNILIKCKLWKTAFILWIQMRVGRQTGKWRNSTMAQIRSTLKCCLIRIFKTFAYFSGEMLQTKIWWISLLYNRCHEIFINLN